METNPQDTAPKPAGREWTEEQRQAARERMQAINANRRGKPRAATGRKRADSKPKPPLGARGSRAKQLGKRITEGITFVAAIVSAKEPFDGMVLGAGAPRLGETYAAVLDRHPRALQVLSQLESGGVYGAAAIATLAVALPIMAHHGMLPVQLAPLAAMLTPAPEMAAAAAAWTNGGSPGDLGA